MIVVFKRVLKISRFLHLQTGNSFIRNSRFQVIACVLSLHNTQNLILNVKNTLFEFHGGGGGGEGNTSNPPPPPPPHQYASVWHERWFLYVLVIRMAFSPLVVRERYMKRYWHPDRSPVNLSLCAKQIWALLRKTLLIELRPHQFENRIKVSSLSYTNTQSCLK